MEWVRLEPISHDQLIIQFISRKTRTEVKSTRKALRQRRPRSYSYLDVDADTAAGDISNRQCFIRDSEQNMYVFMY